MSDSYKDKIYEVAVNAFEVTCYMFPLEEWELEDGREADISETGTRSVVDFEGAVEGQMIVNPSDKLLSAMAANMLGVEEPDKEQQEGALYEIANIICGNTVPQFSDTEDVCYINPPRIIKGDRIDQDKISEQTHHETVQVFLDEGAAEITIDFSLNG